MTAGTKTRLPASKGVRKKADSTLLRALDLQAKGESEEARKLFLALLKTNPDDCAVLYSLAAIEANAGQHQAALGHINRAIAINPQFAQALLARSVVHFHLGNFQEALQDVEAACALAPALPGAEAHRTAVLAARAAAPHPAQSAVSALCFQALKAQDARDLPEASRLFSEALAADPGNFIALYSMGVIANQQGKLESALAFLMRATEHHPLNPQGHFALATTLQAMGLHEQALIYFDKAIDLKPDYMEAYNNKATLLHSMNRQGDALISAEAALRACPGDEKSLNNKGYLLTEYKQYAAAAGIFKQLLEINPDHDYVLGLHAYARLHACDWSDFEANRTRIIEGVRQGKRVCNPMAFMAISDDAKNARRCAEIFSQHRFPKAPQALWRGETYLHRRKRVAFISADFREHPVGYLLIGLIENLSKSHFETVGISLGIRDGSSLYRRYRNAFDHYLDCADKPSAEIARLMRAMEIDIAIDLSGYTAGARLDILSWRAAPVQMTYLGFPGTLGTDYVDYLIGDRISIPDSAQPHYAEKVLHLPHCYLPRDTGIQPAANAPPKSEFGLPEKGTVFCSFNHDYKIAPTIFSAWMDLLRSAPGSVLWLMKLNDDARANLAKAADAHGIDPSRLVFATRVPSIEDHLARYRHADVCLDTFPYNGHTTTSDALLAGVPVVTLTGNNFASRVASSLLHDAGVSQWCCQDISRYIELAQTIALGDPHAAKRELQERCADRWPISEKQQALAFGEILMQSRSI